MHFEYPDAVITRKYKVCKVLDWCYSLYSNLRLFQFLKVSWFNTNNTYRCKYLRNKAEILVYPFIFCYWTQMQQKEKDLAWLSQYFWRGLYSSRDLSILNQSKAAHHLMVDKHFVTAFLYFVTYPYIFMQFWEPLMSRRSFSIWLKAAA